MGIQITPQQIVLPTLMKLAYDEYFATFVKELVVNYDLPVFFLDTQFSNATTL